MNAIIEKWYPAVVGLIVFLMYMVWFRTLVIPKTFCNLLPASLTISAIAVGFIATAKAIILSIKDKRILKQIREVGKFNVLIDYMMAAIHLCFIFAIMSSAALLIDFENPPVWEPYAIAVWLFFGATSLSACYRVIHLFSKILKS